MERKAERDREEVRWRERLTKTERKRGRVNEREGLTTTETKNEKAESKTQCVRDPVCC